MRPLRVLAELVRELFALPIRYLPGGVGHALRYRYYKRRLKHLGTGAIIDVGVQIQHPEYVSIGDNTWIDTHVILLAGPPGGGRETVSKPNANFLLPPGHLHIGNNVHIGPFGIISAMVGVFIGNDVTFSADCKVYSLTHHYRSFRDPSNASMSFGSMVRPDRQAMLAGPVVFHDNSGMALNSVVLPGITVGANSFVGINSVVFSDIPPNSVVRGDPARVRGQRFTNSISSGPR